MLVKVKEDLKMMLPSGLFFCLFKQVKNTITTSLASLRGNKYMNTLKSKGVYSNVMSSMYNKRS
jgi:hypothetical protein